MGASLVWGSVNLMPTDVEAAALGYKIQASADGTNWGNPEAVVTAVQSRLQDGSLAVVDSYQNREARIGLRVTAPTYDGLAAGEAALVAETRRESYGTLTWTPDEVLAEPTVFDVVYAVLNHDFDDYAEVHQLTRRFVATLNCLPFGRSQAEVTAVAPVPPPSTPVVTLVDNGSSTTGWTGSPNAPTTAGGAVIETVSVTNVDACSSTTGWSSTHSAPTVDSGISVRGDYALTAPFTAAIARAGTIDTSVAKYLAIDAYVTMQGFVWTGSAKINLDGVQATILATEPGARAGFTRIWVKAPGAAVNNVSVNFSLAGSGGPVQNVIIMVDNILKSDLGPDQRVMSLTRTGSITTSSTPYLMIDYIQTGSSPGVMSVPDFLLDGVPVPTLATVPQGGFSRAYVKAPGASVNTVTIRSTCGANSSINTAALSVDQINRTDAAPASGTRRQLVRSLPVKGSVRTQGRLAVEHETVALGETLIYVYTDDGSGYVPALRPFFFAGSSTTVDPNLYSGGSNMLDTLQEYRVAANLLPRGTGRLMARLKGNSAGPVTLNVNVYTRIGSVDVPGTITFSATVTVATTYAMFDLGPLTLPATRVPTPAGATVRITIVDADTSGIDVDLDEAYWFNLDIGTLTHVDCGTASPAVGGPSKRLWLDPATVTNDGQDAIYRGHTADRSDAFNPADSIRGWTPPVFEPPAMNVFTACNALDVAVSLAHFPRHLHHARASA